MHAQLFGSISRLTPITLPSAFSLNFLSFETTTTNRTTFRQLCKMFATFKDFTESHIKSETMCIVEVFEFHFRCAIIICSRFRTISGWCERQRGKKLTSSNVYKYIVFVWVLYKYTHFKAIGHGFCFTFDNWLIFISDFKYTNECDIGSADVK